MAIPPNHLFATLKDHIGHDFGESSPTRLDQPRIDRFAECTGDDQWIHLFMLTRPGETARRVERFIAEHRSA